MRHNKGRGCSAGSVAAAHQSTPRLCRIGICGPSAPRFDLMGSPGLPRHRFGPSVSEFAAPNRRWLLAALLASCLLNGVLLASSISQNRGVLGASRCWAAPAREQPPLAWATAEPAAAAPAEQLAAAPSGEVAGNTTAPSVFVVLARHEEDIRWLDKLPSAVRQAQHIRIAIYQAGRRRCA